MQQRPLGIQDKKLRIISDLWIMREESVVGVFFAVVNFQAYIKGVAHFAKLGVAIKRLVHDVAVDAPVSSDLQQDPFIGLGGYSNSVLKILGRVPRRIIADDRFWYGWQRILRSVLGNRGDCEAQAYNKRQIRFPD